MSRDAAAASQSWPVHIFIAGDVVNAKETCSAYCDEVGLCVTVSETTYIYKGGSEAGVVVGLINYPRFPSSQNAITDIAIDLGWRLHAALGQQSFTVQTPGITLWFSTRADVS